MQKSKSVIHEHRKNKQEKPNFIFSFMRFQHPIIVVNSSCDFYAIIRDCKNMNMYRMHFSFFYTTND